MICWNVSTMSFVGKHGSWVPQGRCCIYIYSTPCNCCNRRNLGRPRPLNPPPSGFGTLRAAAIDRPPHAGHSHHARSGFGTLRAARSDRPHTPLNPPPRNPTPLPSPQPPRTQRIRHVTRGSDRPHTPLNPPLCSIIAHMTLFIFLEPNSISS